MITCNINIRGMYRLDGLEYALVGASLVTGLVYSESKIIEGLMREQGWTYEEAAEWFDVNIAPIGLLDGGPVFVD